MADRQIRDRVALLLRRAAFQRDLEQMGKAAGVLCLGFSEFGRRVRENGGGGIDHGAAGLMFGSARVCRSLRGAALLRASH